jgi:hypothetical protein
MKGSNLNRVSKVVILTILYLSFSSTSFSQNFHINGNQGTQQSENTQKWHSNNAIDAGMSAGTVILIGVGVAAAVTAIILIANSGGDDNSNDGKGEENVSEKKSIEQIDANGMNSLIQYNLKNEYSEYKEKYSPINIYLNIKQNKFQLSENTYEIGIAFNF